jgi:hypothetical protein
MKKTLLILGAALALAGCGRDQGATSDQYQTDRGTGNSISNASSPIGATSDSLTPASSSEAVTNSLSATNSDAGASDYNKTPSTP